MLYLIKGIAKNIAPNWLWTALSFCKSIFLVSDAKGLKSIRFIKKKSQAVVLGNGPSLDSDIEKIAELAGDYDFVCVNNFATSAYYKKLKPVTYVFLDGYFFSKHAHPDWIEQRERTFNAINSDTNWPMQIFLPIGADKSILKRQINNSNVEIIKFRVLPYMPKSSFKAINRYKSGFLGPYQCNVLIYAIYLAIWSGFKKIEIYGADLSFHNDVRVNQKNNQVEMRFRHFNSNDHVERLMKNPLKIEPFTMTELMQTTANTFLSHQYLNEYAIKCGISVINKSSFSLIDCYKRQE